MSLISQIGDKMQEGRDNEVQALVDKASQLLAAKMYKMALLTLNKAYEVDSQSAVDLMTPLLEHFERAGDYEAVLSLGLVVLKAKPDDYKLANRLGNAARRAENYTQAENLYRHTLQINPEFEVAHYNLAACRAKADVYDGAVRDLLRSHFNYTHFVLPKPHPVLETIEHVRGRIHAVKAKKQEEHLAQLNAERNARAEAMDLLGVHGLERKIDEEKQRNLDPTLEEIWSFFHYHFDQLKKESDSEETKKIIADELYNLVLFAIENTEWDRGLQALEEATRLNPKMEYLPLLHAICLRGKGEINTAANLLIEELGKDPYSRFYNLNLALVYRESDTQLIHLKYAIIAASLIQKSEGLLQREEIYQRAVDHFESAKYEKALHLFEIVSAEEKSPLALWYIAQIHLKKNEMDEAVVALKQILAINPKSKLAQQKLDELQATFTQKGEAAFHEHKYKVASVFFEKALEIQRTRPAIVDAIKVYRLLKAEDRIIQLHRELEEMKNAERADVHEKNRQEYIRQGVKYFKRKAYYQAIQQFENAFRMKLDKTVFLYLATLYKFLHKKDDLKGLMDRWRDMVEFEEKRKAVAKMQAQAEKAGQLPMEVEASASNDAPPPQEAPAKADS